MGIFILWQMLRSNKMLNQIRRNQLSPAERDAEDGERAAEGLAAHPGVSLLIILILGIAGYFFHG